MGRSTRILLLLLPSAVCGLSSVACSDPTSLNVYFDSSNGLHRDLSPQHPEQPHRITACLRRLQELQQRLEGRGRIDLQDVAEEPQVLVEGLTPRRRPFTEAELLHARAMLLAAHAEELVTKLEDSTRAAVQRRREESKDPLGHMGYIDNDTYITTASLEVCLRATAAWIRAVDDVLSPGRPTDASCPAGSLALTRPPGHHATAKGSNGFCLFNFAAAAALHATGRDPAARVSVLDWDVHYGQGVADIVQHHPRIRYASIHQRGCFPHLGESLSVLGRHGNVLTVPIQPDTTWTCGYADAYQRALDFLIEPGAWEPDVVIVCAGFDALDSDELASCALVATDFHEMTRRLYRQVASCRQRRPGVMMGLEGGYQLSPMAGGGGLPDAVAETVKAILEQFAAVAGSENADASSRQERLR